MATKAAAEAEEAKAAVMQAGEVLMAELDDLHDARDHLTHRIARACLVYNILKLISGLKACLLPTSKPRRH